MRDDVVLHVVHLDQDDPRKCTARRMEREGTVVLHSDLRRLPRRGILLDPSADLLLRPDDVRAINRGVSLIALDCSWKHLSSSFDDIGRRSPRLEGRTLPVLLAGNPISWGKPGRLSTVEALAASLFLMGRSDQAERVLSPFRWGSGFIELNAAPLAAYASARDRKELAELQWEFFDEPDDESANGGTVPNVS